MKGFAAVFDWLAKNPEPGTPPIVTDAMARMADKFSKPPEPVMTRVEFDALPKHTRCFLVCNMPGCGDVVCTHGMLCVKHKEESKAWMEKLSKKGSNEVDVLRDMRGSGDPSQEGKLP